MDQGWEDRADSWIEWARRPDFDGYWRYRDAFFDEVIPKPRIATLDVRCGEGRVSRDLVDRGHHVTGIDASPTLVAAAASAHPNSRYEVGMAENLPFENESFDLVVAYNSLMDVGDMPKAMAEIGRVVSAQGRLAVCATHPVNDCGVFASDSDDAPFVIEGSYRGQRQFEFHAEREGLTMDFAGFAYDLEAYSRAMEGAGLVIEMLREPGPTPLNGKFRDRRDRIPNFLMFRALKIPS